jgi:syringomycin synthetase protein SyrE
MEYVGRRDSSIKIRGRLVDSGELERTIVSIPGVTDAIVVSRDGSSGEPELVAVVVAPESTTAAEIRAALRTRLPDLIPPAVIVFRDTLPHTPFGKIDRRAVMEMATGMEEQVEGLARGHAEGTPLETQIAAIWASALGLREVSMDVPFLAQGGDSLHALQILLRLCQDLNIEMTPAVFYALPTVASQASYIETRWVDGASRVRKPACP